MTEDIQKSRRGTSPTDRQNDEVELDAELDIDVKEGGVADEDRGIVSDDERAVSEREAELGQRVTRDDGDNDDGGELT